MKKEIFKGTFPFLEKRLAETVRSLKERDPLLRMTVLVPSRKMVPFLERRLFSLTGGGLFNVEFIPFGGFAGEITRTEPLGVETIVHIRSGEQTLLSLAPGVTDVGVGDQVQFDIIRERLHYFERDGMRIEV